MSQQAVSEVNKVAEKTVVLIIGKLPPPYFGPAIATKIILNSSLKEDFILVHLDNSLNISFETMGKGSLRKVFMNLVIYVRLIRILRRQRPNLVLIPISQTTKGFLKDAIFVWLSSFFRTKVLIQLRGSNFKNWQSKAGILIRWFTRLTCMRAEGVIVLGRSLIHLFDGYFGKDQIHVVPNGADYQVVRKPKSAQGLKIIHLANLIESKGFRDVVEAMVLVEGERPGSWTMDVIGNWGSKILKDYCLKTVEENNLPIHFHPESVSERKMEMLGDADLFIFTPREPEGHPWVIIEAMAASLPIITTDQGAIRESVVEGENGFFIKPKSPTQIAERVVRLIDDPKLGIDMGANSRKKYEASFTEEMMVANLKRVFLTVLDGS